MDNLIERIARHADIDTRRAMGFPPRRLVVPDLHIRLPLVRESPTSHAGYGPPKPIAQQDLSIGWYMYIVNFENGIQLQMYPSSMTEYWYFCENPGDVRYKTAYSFMYDTKMNFWTEKGWKYSTHPDFNDDGSFKRTKPAL
jgi:hypothetical protein